MSRRNSNASNIAIIVFCAFILVHLIFDFNHHIFGRASQKAAQNKEHFFIDIESEKVSKINEETAKKTQNVPKKSERSWNSTKMEEYHKKFIKKLTDSDRKSWMKKIWQTKNLESHENREEVNILWWLQHGKTREAQNFDQFKVKNLPNHPSNTVNSRINADPAISSRIISWKKTWTRLSLRTRF
jgi:hypothetical protein